MSSLNIFNYKKHLGYLESEISILESKLNEANEQLKEKDKLLNQERDEINDLKRSLSKLEKHCDDLKTFINSRLPLLDTDSITDSSTFESMQSLWVATLNTIPDEDKYYQLQRMERACDARFTPLDLCADTRSGHFRGMDEDYYVSLTRCDCMDFQRHALPCKHMYRLAHELGIFMLEDVEYVPEPKKIMFRSKFKQAISSLSELSKEILEEFGYTPVVVASRSNLNQLLKAELVQISDCKLYLLDHYKRDELFSLLPDDAKVKKSAKKSELIDIILSDYPDIITNLEKLTLPVELSPYVKHLVSSI